MPSLSGLLLGLALLAPAQARAQVKAGIDVLEEEGFASIRGKSIGLITNQTGKDAAGRSTLSVLASAPGASLKVFFAPEHGASGNLEDENIASGTYRLPGGATIPMYGLYGATKAPTAQMLSGLDALVFDVQSIGARFYTYDATMAMAMEAAARAGIEFIVLDRPDPINGETVEGPVLEDGIRHITAYFPISVRHGMTVGEIAGLHNAVARVGARLRVVKLKGWKRSWWYDRTGLPWTKPSPNMPDLEAAALYPGVGCFEASNIAVGRGTPIPFRWVGAPWMDSEAVLQRLRAAKLAGVEFSAQEFTPEKSVFKGERCRGIRIRITDRDKARPLAVFAHLACALRDLHPKDFAFRFEEEARMVGTRRFQRLYEQGAGPEEMMSLFEGGAAAFSARRKPFLLY